MDTTTETKTLVANARYGLMSPYDGEDKLTWGSSPTDQEVIVLGEEKASGLIRIRFSNGRRALVQDCFLKSNA
jgi:hypothetical protein